MGNCRSRTDQQENQQQDQRKTNSQQQNSGSSLLGTLFSAGAAMGLQAIVNHYAPQGSRLSRLAPLLAFVYGRFTNRQNRLIQLLLQSMSENEQDLNTLSNRLPTIDSFAALLQLIGAVMSNANPVSEQVKDSLQVVNASVQLQQEECSICLQSFNPDQEITVLKCRHLYHKECVSQWMRLANTCPVCRARIN